MKHKLVLLVSTGVVVAASVSAVNTHRDYIHQQAIQEAVTAVNAAKQAAIQKAEEAAAAATAKHQLDTLDQNCRYGLAAYQLLTPAQQKHLTKPSCTL